MPATMPATMIGADADELERIAGTLRSVADELDSHAGSVTTTLRSVAWVGGVAARFGSNWHGGHRPRIAATAEYVRDAARQLDRNAAEQRQASRGGGQAGGRGGPGPTIGPPVPDPAGSGGSSSSIGDAPGNPTLDRIGDLLTTFGAGRDAVEALAEHAHLLEGAGVDRLLDILTDDDFVALLAGLDKVLEVGDVVVDLVSDFVEHPTLPFDERIVHALADAATLFGIDQGVEYAANFLAQAATTALLPGLGAALAPFAGQAAGAIADAVIGEIVDAVDGATDVVDIAADGAVDAYRAFKEAFGLVLDAAGAVIDVAGDAVDLAGDVAGAVVDAGGTVIGAGADAVGGVVGSLNPFD
ncbi:MAG: hypothetical protein R8G01_15735 [Ilumatobacteraceae bacterium]|nr:hypothetical protein [Ilumatobacteraceae bacterium]